MTIGSSSNPPAWVIAARQALARLRGQGEAAAYRTMRTGRGSGIMTGLQNVNRNVRSIFRK